MSLMFETSNEIIKYLLAKNCLWYIEPNCLGLHFKRKYDNLNDNIIIVLMYDIDGKISFYSYINDGLINIYKVGPDYVMDRLRRYHSECISHEIADIICYNLDLFK